MRIPSIRSSRRHFRIATWVAACLFADPLCAQAPRVLREDFREVPAHIPVATEDLTHPGLTLLRLGPTADKLKLSFHPKVENDPHYVWNGECGGPVLLGFAWGGEVDLSAADTVVRVRTKNVGKSRLHLAVRSAGRWFMGQRGLRADPNWRSHDLRVEVSGWRRWNPRQGRPGAVGAPDLRRVTAIGFVSPRAARRSRDCTRLDWFELRSSSARLPVRREDAGGRGFFEPATRCLRSAMVVAGGRTPNRTRRGVLVPVAERIWACFDPDLLRWAAVWKAPVGAPPISLDSMAAVSYPDRQAKAVRPPELRGELLWASPELPGASVGRRPGADPRAATLLGRADPVGPMPRGQGRFQGVTLTGTLPILRYRIGTTGIEECLRRSGEDLCRTLKIGPRTEPVALRLDPATAQVEGLRGTLPGGGWPALRVFGTGLQLRSDSTGTWLVVAPGRRSQVVTVWRSARPTPDAQPVPGFPPRRPAAWGFAPARTVVHDTERRADPFAMRGIPMPASTGGARAVRPTDLAFLPDGTGLLTTLDGDLWRVEGLETDRSRWRRVATGLFEPLDIETTGDGRVLVLGRDQVTELLDDDGDGQIDRFENRGDGFLQTLHTRDFATSLVVEPDGSFLLAKGGIMGGASFDVRSAHRGAVVRLRPDGRAQVLAVGLRIPFLGRRRDGALFVSDQQGHFIPSTPVHRLGADRPFLGFEPTRQGAQPVREPLVSYPYQVNRSGAGFAGLDRRGFADLGGAFAHVSWSGRLFPIETPKSGVPFSWRLPVQLDFPALKAATHPQSAALYVVGLGISGYKPLTPKLLGLAALRQAGPLLAPRQLHLGPREVRVTFARPPGEGVRVSVTGLRVFDLRRTGKYGSGHYRWDGQPGEHRIEPGAPAWNSGRTELRIPVPYLYRGDVLELRLMVAHLAGKRPSYPLELYARAADLPAPDAAELRRVAAEESARPAVVAGSAARGRLVFTRFACNGCHSLQGQRLVGPPLDGIASRIGGGLEQKLRASILQPSQTVTPGYAAVMPSFAGVIPAQDLEDLLAYLKTLK